MKSFSITLLLLVLLFSCSTEENTVTSEDSFNISGQFLAPNGVDPISNARVSAYQNETLKANAFTDPQGLYSLTLPSGSYTLVLNKGKFKTEKSITVETDMTLDSYSVETLPNIAVVTGYFDNIENVLYNLGLVNPITGEPLFDIIEGNEGLSRFAHDQTSNHAHQHNGSLNRSDSNPFLDPNVDFNFGDLMDDPDLMSSYDIIFLNCGVSEILIDDSGVLDDYVTNGGLLYATDYAAGYLDAITSSGTEYITPYVPLKSGTSTSTVATILDGDLSEWLLLNFNISIDDTILIDDFLNSWQVIDTYDDSTTISWLNGPVTYLDGTGTEIAENKDLAFTFLHGNGGVFYSSFHTENHDTDEVTDVDRIMQFLVLEMADLN